MRLDHPPDRLLADIEQRGDLGEFGSFPHHASVSLQPSERPRGQGGPTQTRPRLRTLSSLTNISPLRRFLSRAYGGFVRIA